MSSANAILTNQDEIDSLMDSLAAGEGLVPPSSVGAPPGTVPPDKPLLPDDFDEVKWNSGKNEESAPGPIPKTSKCALVCCPICGGYWDYPIDDWGRSKILPPHKNFLTGEYCPGSGKLPNPISVTKGPYAQILAAACGLHTILVE